jgi:hypothetical protein
LRRCQLIEQDGQDKLLGEKADPSPRTGNPQSQIKDLMAGGTDEEPFELVSIFFQHGVKTILVSADRAVTPLFVKGKMVDLPMHWASRPLWLQAALAN